MKCCTEGHDAKAASITVSNKALTMGPYSEPTPPKSTSNKMKIDKWKLMNSELMY